MASTTTMPRPKRLPAGRGFLLFFLCPGAEAPAHRNGSNADGNVQQAHGPGGTAKPRGGNPPEAGNQAARHRT